VRDNVVTLKEQGCENSYLKKTKVQFKRNPAVHKGRRRTATIESEDQLYERFILSLVFHDGLVRKDNRRHSGPVLSGKRSRS
jgi:hypothetical protein